MSSETPKASEEVGMTFSQRNLRRCESPLGFNHKLDSWSLSDWFIAVMGELGEAANVLKKLNRVRDGIPGNSETPKQLRAKLADEMADADIYLDLAFQAAGIDRDAARELKFARTSAKIGYVEPKCDQPAPARTTAEEIARQFGDAYRIALGGWTDSDTDNLTRHIAPLVRRAEIGDAWEKEANECAEERDTLRAECERLRTTVEATEAQRNLRLKQRDAAETDLATLRGLAADVVKLAPFTYDQAQALNALAAWLKEHCGGS